MADIQHEQNETGGRYVMALNGAEAELTYRNAGEGRIVADHTLVPGAMRGQGVAAQLVDRLIADARDRNWKIVPACSYVAAAFKRHPDWADLRAD